MRLVRAARNGSNVDRVAFFFASFCQFLSFRFVFFRDGKKGGAVDKKPVSRDTMGIYVGEETGMGLVKVAPALLIRQKVLWEACWSFL